MFKAREYFDADRVHAAAITCSDGRWGRQIDDFLERGLYLPRYDRVAVPGGAGCLGGHLISSNEAAAIKHQLALLVHVHELTKVILVAHQDCAFYVVRLKLVGADLKKQQREDLAIAARLIRGEHPGIEVESYFAQRRGHRVSFVGWDRK